MIAELLYDRGINSAVNLKIVITKKIKTNEKAA
ncbi:hypothetical protein BAPKO_6021 (plasmid) [Borreliella afzelii PKo]|nr:hypothetical protein BAPKO_6021 [Borreliella afzelii PKo]